MLQPVSRTLYWATLLLTTFCGGLPVHAEPVAPHTAVVAGSPHRPLHLLIDEYHQIRRPDSFSHGFSLNQDEQELTYHYATDATGLVNGLFVLEQLIAPDFSVSVSTDPIGADLAQRTDAYMIVCPPKPLPDGPPGLTPEDGDHLEAFVAAGGMLVLVYNSVADPEADGFDFAGMNGIAERFGIEFLPTTTRTVSIPIGRDHPVFFGSRSIIYGNGCTIATHEQADTRHQVLLESTNPDVPGAVAVRARYKRGTVLALGDAGTLGNAHMVRDDVGHAEAVKQLFHALLPDGPVPAYGWERGLQFNVRLRHELTITGSPEKMRLLDLPLDPAAESVIIGVRELDLQSARPDARENAEPQADAASLPAGRYAMARARWQTQAVLNIGDSDGRAFAARWSGTDGAQLRCRITPRGVVLAPSAHDDALTEWRWALTGEVIVGPLDPAAQTGDRWQSPVMTPLPSAQLHPVPQNRRATGRFRFVGREICRGRPCFVISKTVIKALPDLQPQDLVAPQFADYFDQTKVRSRHAGHTCLVKTWIDEATRLPVKTELRASTSFWWTDHREEDWFLSDHDYRVFETRNEIRRVTIIGRSLVAEFDQIETTASKK